jgi:hypothetical protein
VANQSVWITMLSGQTPFSDDDPDAVDAVVGDADAAALVSLLLLLPQPASSAPTAAQPTAMEARRFGFTGSFLRGWCDG